MISVAIKGDVWDSALFKAAYNLSEPNRDKRREDKELSLYGLSGNGILYIIINIAGGFICKIHMLLCLTSL